MTGFRDVLTRIYGRDFSGNSPFLIAPSLRFDLEGAVTLECQPREYKARAEAICDLHFTGAKELWVELTFHPFQDTSVIPKKMQSKWSRAARALCNLSRPGLRDRSIQTSLHAFIEDDAWFEEFDGGVQGPYLKRPVLQGPLDPACTYWEFRAWFKTEVGRPLHRLLAANGLWNIYGLRSRQAALRYGAPWPIHGMSARSIGSFSMLVMDPISGRLAYPYLLDPGMALFAPNREVMVQTYETLKGWILPHYLDDAKGWMHPAGVNG